MKLQGKEVGKMGRDEHRHSRGKNKTKLPQTPENQKTTDGVDMKFSAELADHEDKEAQARGNAADARSKRS